MALVSIDNSPAAAPATSGACDTLRRQLAPGSRNLPQSCAATNSPLTTIERMPSGASPALLSNSAWAGLTVPWSCGVNVSAEVETSGAGSRSGTTSGDIRNTCRLAELRDAMMSRPSPAATVTPAGVRSRPGPSSQVPKISRRLPSTLKL